MSWVQVLLTGIFFNINFIEGNLVKVNRESHEGKNLLTSAEAKVTLSVNYLNSTLMPMLAL